MNRGFLLLEVLLAIFLAGILWMSLSTAYIQVGENWQNSSARFDIRQQQRVVMEEIIRKIRQAKPGTIRFLEGPDARGVYTRLEMNLNYEPERAIAFYQRGENILKGVKNPGRERFTGMSIALNAGKLVFKPADRRIVVKIQEEISSLESEVFVREGAD